MTVEISSDRLESALKSAGAAFGIDQVIKSLHAGRSDALRRRVEQFIAGDGGYFYDDEWNCRKKDDFFARRRFVVTPDEWEISEGILFPGHRFVPFVNEEVFPSTVVLKAKGGAEMPSRELHAPLGKIFHYHVLLGSEQIFDFLIAESQSNAFLSQGGDGSETVTLAVFDLKDFYVRNNFQFGDALLCCVSDYNAGHVEFEFLPGARRNFGKIRAWAGVLDGAIERVCGKFEDYLDIPEQLGWAFFYAGDQLEPDCSLDEFIASSEKIEIRADGDHAVLSIRNSGGENDAESPGSLPDGLTISNGETGDPSAMLAQIGSPLSLVELDGYILDGCYARESDFELFHSRAFAHTKLDFADEAQQAVMTNFLEERFEQLCGNYNRYDDEPKAPLRSTIMELVDDRQEFLAFLGELDGDICESEHDMLHKLAETGGRLGEILKMLNNPAFTPDEAELTRLEAMIDSVADEQERILDDFHAHRQNCKNKEN